MLKRLVQRETADTIELGNGINIEVTTNDQRRVRGRTVVAAIFDEIAHWRPENTANPDREVYRAVKPAMVTIPGALLIGISSPYARRGPLWQKHQAHWGKAGSVLVIKAPTWLMNPTVSRDGETIAEAYDTDPEWGPPCVNSGSPCALFCATPRTPRGHRHAADSSVATARPA
jgi:hypothetical protein